MHCYCPGCSYRKRILHVTKDTELHRLVLCEDVNHSSLHELLKREDPNIRNGIYETPLHLSALKDNSDIVAELIKAGAKVQSFDLYINTPLHIAVLHCNRKVTELLLQSGADVNSENVFGYTPLHFAVKSWLYRKPEARFKRHDKLIVQKLIQAGADVNICNRFNETPLFRAVGTGNFDIVQELLNSGANANICNSDYISCLHLALRKLHPNQKIIEELIKRGANINFKDKWFMSPLQLAILRYFDDPLDELKTAKTLIKLGILVHPGESIDIYLTNETVNNVLCEFKRLCSTEITQMKSVRIAENISLYDFALRGINFCVFSCNKYKDKLLSRVLLALLKRNYVVYIDIILCYLPKIYLKEVLMKISIVSRNKNNGNETELLKDVVWLICDYLNLTEILALIKASSIVDCIYFTRD